METDRSRIFVKVLQASYQDRDEFELALENRERLEAVAKILVEEHGYKVTWHQSAPQIHVDKRSSKDSMPGHE